MILDDFAGLVKDADRVVVRLAFVDDVLWWLGFLFDGQLVLVDGVPEGDGGRYTVDGRQLAMTGKHEEVVVTYRWLMEGRRLTLRALKECRLSAGIGTHCKASRSKMDALMLLVTENTFVRSGNKATFDGPGGSL